MVRNEPLSEIWRKEQQKITLKMTVILGNGLMDEKEFRQWIQRIQLLQDDAVSPSTSTSTSQSETEDDVTQDLIAAFR